MVQTIPGSIGRRCRRGGAGRTADEAVIAAVTGVPDPPELNDGD